MTTLADLQRAIRERFEATFGRTPLAERVQDILTAASSPARYTDMLHLREERCLGVFDYEIRHRFRGETYHSIKKLLTEDIARNQCEFSFIIGQDNADDFATWSNADSLERMIRFIVLPRAGRPVPSLSA